MADHTGSWYPVGPVLWDQVGPYRATSDGQKSYIPPIAAAQAQNDPKLLAWAKAHGANITYGAPDANGTQTTSNVQTGVPEGGFAGNYHWNGDSGGYEKDNPLDSSLGGLILGASSVAAPFALSALAGSPAAAGGAAADLGDAAGLADSAATGGSGLLASTPIDAGLFTAPTAAPSAAISAGVAAPGATLPNWLKTAQGVGDALSAASVGRAEGRLQEGAANQGQNRAAVDLYNTELNAPRTIARNAVKGDVLANAQDVNIARPSTIPDFQISGGLRPSMFSAATRQTGRNISTAAANTPIPSPTAPVLPPLPEAGGLDSFLNTASTISGLSRAIPPDWWGSIGKGIKQVFA